MNASLDFINRFHELLLRDPQVGQNSCSLIPVLPDEAENGLGEVLYHVFGLGPSFSEVRLHLSHRRVLRIRIRTAV
jgi:hypothetical protein